MKKYLFLASTVVLFMSFRCSKHTNCEAYNGIQKVDIPSVVKKNIVKHQQKKSEVKIDRTTRR